MITTSRAEYKWSLPQKRSLKKESRSREVVAREAEHRTLAKTMVDLG